jgi:hypothetical protein
MSKLKSSNRHIERDALRAFLDADEVGMADECQQIPAVAAGDQPHPREGKSDHPSSTTITASRIPEEAGYKTVDTFTERDSWISNHKAHSIIACAAANVLAAIWLPLPQETPHPTLKVNARTSYILLWIIFPYG